MTVKKLKARNAEIFINHKVVEVDGNCVFIESDDGKKTIEGIDKIVVATGMNSYVPFDKVGLIPVYFVGDAKKVGKAQEAIYEAYKLAINL